MLNIFSELVVKFEKQPNWQYKILIYPWILPYFGLNNALKDLADPPHFSPEIGAPETFKKSPETTETMASLLPIQRMAWWYQVFTFGDTFRKKTSVRIFIKQNQLCQCFKYKRLPPHYHLFGSYISIIAFSPKDLILREGREWGEAHHGKSVGRCIAMLYNSIISLSGR